MVRVEVEGGGSEGGGRTGLEAGGKFPVLHKFVAIRLDRRHLRIRHDLSSQEMINNNQ